MTKLILPAIDRMLSLMGVKAANWYQELPRELRVGGCIDEMAMYGGSEKSKKVLILVHVFWLAFSKFLVVSFSSSGHFVSVLRFKTLHIMQVV